LPVQKSFSTGNPKNIQLSCVVQKAFFESFDLARKRERRRRKRGRRLPFFLSQNELPAKVTRA
jgi:hypothetical protein